MFLDFTVKKLITIETIGFKTITNNNKNNNIMFCVSGCFHKIMRTTQDANPILVLLDRKRVICSWDVFSPHCHQGTAEHVQHSARPC